jgi:cell division protein FtsB
MTKRAYELLVRFGQGEVIAGAHVKEMHLDEDGKDLRETAPIPLADTDNPAFEAFATKFSAKTVAENEVLKYEKATLESDKSSLISQLALKTTEAESLAEDKATLQAEKTDLLSQVSTLESEKTALTSQIASLTEQKETLITEKSELVASHNTEKATLNTALAAANARIVHLTNELPFNPREISVHSFKSRLFRVLDTEDIVRLYAAESDLVLKQIASTIANWDAAYPVRLDSEELQKPLGYLVHIELLTPDEVVSLRRDATRTEAYFAPEEE